MTFLALVIIGCVTYVTLPVSLLPDIAIPHITVQVDGDNMSARELENSVVAPVRRQLMQVDGLAEIKSETRDGAATIAMTMDFGVNTDLAFIEVNEKIDGAMNSLPKTVSRPKAVKASATDIPVVYLHMTADNDSEESFLEVSNIAENIVRRRLEQLPEIAMVDITGVPGQILRITPDNEKMASAGVSVEDLEGALESNNVDPGSMTVRDGYYEYNISVTNTLRTPEDVRGIQILTKSGRVMPLSDLANVELTSRTPNGYSTHNGRRAVTMAVIKHSEESMDAMKDAMRETVDYFASQYPGIQFYESRNQTELLDFTISNLEQNLILGLLLVFFVCILFMGGWRPSFIIGLSIIVGVILTFLLFYFFHVTINIISMSGLILAVGMMIDNSVIVTENITQWRGRGDGLMDACVRGTNEMITPMLSSSMTTVAVFVPLVFMSGIAGAIFADQAFSITAGLASSYVVGITLLPVLYFIFSKKKATTHAAANPSQQKTHSVLLAAYDRGMDFCFRHKWPFIIATLAMVPLCAVLFGVMRQERMPHIDSFETVMTVDWNENINLDENRRRVAAILDSAAVEHSAYIGVQDYLLSSDVDITAAEAQLYFKTASPDDIEGLQSRIRSSIASRHPLATVSFAPPGNIFEKIFSSDEADLEVRLHSISETSGVDDYLRIHDAIAKASGVALDAVPLREQINILIDRAKLAVYKVDMAEVLRVLKTSFQGNTVTTMRSYQEYTPVEIVGNEKTVERVISESFVQSDPDKDGVRTEVPLRSLVTVTRGADFKTITAGSGGEYLPVAFNVPGEELRVKDIVSETVVNDGGYEAEFAGSFFSNAKMMKEMIVILLVSIMLMYFILCSQFESFLQPLIVLLEIPVDTAFALITLMIFGHTLNLMSAIGIIVTCGIVVNDSILKLDAINELRKTGMPLTKAIHTAGRRRIRAIIMTSLTTIFAMVPTLFTSDMGSELQQPLAIAMIGSMVVGTMVSIFVIPLFYWLIYRRQDAKTHQS